MCGICGFYGMEDKKLLKRMADVISYRGPDDSGYYIDKDISLGHRRLSIIDLKTGKQPIFNEDKSIAVVYNGEIYNFMEIRKELEAKGHRFYTNSDTEVIAHSYEEFGENFLALFDGMFAFALWDSNNKKLILARDRAGIKPLYYCLSDKKLFFGSEVKSILQYEGAKRAIDAEALHYLLNLRYIPGEKTMFKGINKLLAGHYLVLSNNEIKIKKYWDLKISIEKKPEGYFVKNLRKLLEESIKKHMIADVPVGAYLSGGLDSSTIVAFASKYSKKPIQTFCMGFNEPTDEFKDARKVANHFGTEHKEFLIEMDLLKALPKTIWHIDMPKRNMWPYFISEYISKYAKVVLSGMGGDELLGGYIHKYNFVDKIEKKRNKSNGIPASNADKKISEQIKKGAIEEDYKLEELEEERSLNDNAGLYVLKTHMSKLYSNKEYLSKIYSENMLKNKLPELKDIFEPYFKNKLSFIQQMFLADFKTKMADDFLLVEDACSMAHSMEVRVPFIENKLIDFCFSMPPEYKVRGKVGKYITRKAMKDVLPADILKKRKWGFIPNTLSWYRDIFKDLAWQILPEGNLVKNNYFKKDFILKILEHKIDKRMMMHYNLIWQLITTEIWHRMYMENDNLYKPNLDINNFV